MHESSIREMKKFVGALKEGPLKIADIGSIGSQAYAALFTKPGWEYVGLALTPGENVQRVLPSEYFWTNVADGEFDVVISGQVIEHVRKPWRWMQEIFRIVKPGGIVCFIGPHSWAFHQAPVDCWRVWPDGMRACMEDAGLVVEKCWKNENDTVGIAQKPAKTVK